MDASNHLYYSNRSICLAETGRVAEAKEDGTACVRLAPNFVKGYHRKANAEFLLGEYGAAEATIRAGLSIDSDMAELKRLLKRVKAKKASELVAARRAAGPSAVSMDQGLRNELSQLSEAYNTSNTELLEVKARLEACHREGRRTDLTQDEIKAMPVETPMYLSVGKVFLRSPRPSVETHLEAERAKQEKERSDLEARKTFLQRRMVSQEANLKDLMGSLMGSPNGPVAPGSVPGAAAQVKAANQGGGALPSQQPTATTGP